MPDKRLDTGIYQTPYGFRVLIRIQGRLETKRFPPTYTLAALRSWRADHARLHRGPKRKRGTFADDVDRYLKAVAAMPSYKDRVREIEAWLPAFGELARWRITPELIRVQLQAWRKTKAASTCNHRRTALGHLYTVLDGKAWPNPVRDVPPFAEPPATRRGVELPIALAAIRRVKGKMTRARLLVLLWTGMRPSELMRVTPAHIDLEQGICEVLTGKGGSYRIIPLNKSATKAFKGFLRVGATGHFSVASVRKALVKACKAPPALPILRVYDLRHTFASALRKAGADLADVGEQLGHRSPRMTRRYAPVVLEKLRVAGDLTRKSPVKVTSPKRTPVSD
jgi:integrase